MWVLLSEFIRVGTFPPTGRGIALAGNDILEFFFHFTPSLLLRPCIFPSPLHLSGPYGPKREKIKNEIMYCFKNKNIIMRNSKIHCAPISGFYLISHLDFSEVARILKHDVKLCSLCTEKTVQTQIHKMAGDGQCHWKESSTIYLPVGPVFVCACMCACLTSY